MFIEQDYLVNDSIKPEKGLVLMNEYILGRLRADSKHVIELSANEAKIQHAGLKGRLRELLIDNILKPWLPPYVSCGTGTIVDFSSSKRDSTQDDIILFDRTLAPPVLSPTNSKEGVFLFNSVLARIEVKSIVNKSAVNDFCLSSNEISKLKFSVFSPQKEMEGKKEMMGALNLFFGFSSDSSTKNDFELVRFVEAMQKLKIDPLSGIVPMICIPGKGFWKIGMKKGSTIKTWQRLNSDNAFDHITWFIACVSNSCFRMHIQRQGRDYAHSLESGIGAYISGDCYIDIDLTLL